MSFFRNEATRTFIAGLLMLPAALFAVAVAPKIGIYEGRAWPVVANYKVIDRFATDGGGFDVIVSFTKVRECKFLDQNWSIEISDNVFEEFQQVFPEDGSYRPQTRTLGKWMAHWHIKAPSSLMNNPLRLIVYHQCWGPALWDTLSMAIDQSPQTEITIKKDAVP